MKESNVKITIKDTPVNAQMLAVMERFLTEMDRVGHFNNLKRAIMEVQSAILIFPADFIDDQQRNVFGSSLLTIYQLADDLQCLIEDTEN